MTEADLYPHLAHLAGGQVYPYVVPLLDGRPSVALPWVVFSLISSVSADVMGGHRLLPGAPVLCTGGRYPAVLLWCFGTEPCRHLLRQR